jgi:hypothetical protein
MEEIMLFQKRFRVLEIVSKTVETLEKTIEKYHGPKSLFDS